MRRLVIMTGLLLGLLAAPIARSAQETKPTAPKKATTSAKKKSQTKTSTASKTGKTSAAKKKAPSAATETKAAKKGTPEKKETPPATAVQHQAPVSTDEVVGKTKAGGAVYAGPRGGHYYLNDNGDKVYVEEWEGAKIIGTTEDGKKIYEGPNGGQYYYSATGNKTYLPKEKKLK
jgi:cytoskeletal protein RodZ